MARRNHRNRRNRRNGDNWRSRAVNGAKEIAGRVNRAVPALAQRINHTWTRGVVDGGFLLGSYMAVNSMDAPSLGKGAAFLGAMAAAPVVDRYIAQPIANAVRRDDENRVTAGSYGSGGWIKSAGLTTLTATLIALSGNFFPDKELVIDVPDKPPAAEIVITDTGKKTRGGYSIFTYDGPAKNRAEISDHFDRWDDKRGDECKNAGSLNVKVIGDEEFIRADCRSDEERVKVPDPTTVGDYTNVNYEHPRLKQLIEGKRFEKGFLSDVEKMCARLDMHAMGLLSVMYFETGGSYSPSIKNPTGSATGLIQFTSQTAKGLGTTTAKLRKMSQRQQLKWVEKYFHAHENGGDYSKPTDIAMTIFFPKYAGKGSGKVLGRKKGGTKFQRRVYRQNRGLDINKNGLITSGEYVRPALTRSKLL